MLRFCIITASLLLVVATSAMGQASYLSQGTNAFSASFSGTNTETWEAGILSIGYTIKGRADLGLTVSTLTYRRSSDFTAVGFYGSYLPVKQGDYRIPLNIEIGVSGSIGWIREWGITSGAVQLVGSRNVWLTHAVGLEIGAGGFLLGATGRPTTLGYLVGTSVIIRNQKESFLIEIGAAAVDADDATAYGQANFRLVFVPSNNK